MHRIAGIFIGGMGEEAGLEQRLILEDEMWFIVPPHHPLAGTETSPARMMDQPFVMREAGSASKDRRRNDPLSSEAALFLALASRQIFPCPD